MSPADDAYELWQPSAITPDSLWEHTPAVVQDTQSGQQHQALMDQEQAVGCLRLWLV